MSKIRVLIADDHAVVRAGLRALIEAQPDMEVVAEAEDGDQVAQRARDTRPHVAVLDIAMPRTNGIEAAAALRRECPDARVLILTMHEDRAFVHACLAAGAAGYVLKRAAGSELVSAIRAVHEGRTYLDVALSSAEAQEAVRGSAADRPAAGGDVDPVPLSRRERQVLELIAQGHTYREVAERLHISVQSVATYRARFSEKLRLRTRAEIVRYALESGLLT